MRVLLEKKGPCTLMVKVVASDKEIEQRAKAKRPWPSLSVPLVPGGTSKLVVSLDPALGANHAMANAAEGPDSIDWPGFRLEDLAKKAEALLA